MSSKMVFGSLLTIVGLIWSAVTIIYAAHNPWNWNGIQGLMGSLLGTRMLFLLLIALATMIVGLVICYKEAYHKDKGE